MGCEAWQNPGLAQPLQLINSCNHSARRTLAETESRDKQFEFDMLLNNCQEIYDGATFSSCIARGPKWKAICNFVTATLRTSVQGSPQHHTSQLRQKLKFSISGSMIFENGSPIQCPRCPLMRLVLGTASQMRGGRLDQRPGLI